MCVIIVCPAKARPDLETLKACAKANPHGDGIAWREGGKVHWLKTDRIEDLHRLAQAKRGELVLHFRIASVGAVCPELRHPFPIAQDTPLADVGKAKAVLFQNGTWRDWQSAVAEAQRAGFTPPEGPMSDARAAAWLCSIYGKRMLKDCGPSRWVFFGAKTTALFGDWHKVKGLHFSNLAWRHHLRPAPAKAPAGIPAATGLATRPEFELWDMTPAKSYWDILERSCPKSRKPAK